MKWQAAVGSLVKIKDSVLSSARQAAVNELVQNIEKLFLCLTIPHVINCIVEWSYSSYPYLGRSISN
jgi:hypothetical protein